MQTPTPSSKSVSDDPGLGPGLAAATTPVQAQPVPAASAATATGSSQFLPVQGGEETTSAEVMLATAYTLMWAVLMLFVYLTFRRQRALERKADELGQALERAQGEDDQPAG